VSFIQYIRMIGINFYPQETVIKTEFQPSNQAKVSHLQLLLRKQEPGNGKESGEGRSHRYGDRLPTTYLELQ
jgi:hypothetical protein